jgi:hypothetical protein
MLSSNARAMLLIACCLLAPIALPLAGESPANGGSAQQLSFEVSDYRDDQGRRWIHLSSEFECLYDERMDDLIATLWNFPNAPKVFSRIETVRVLSRSPTSAVTEQRTAFRLFGFAFISNLIFNNVLVRRGTSGARVSFELIETDGSCLSTVGSWDLEDRSDLSGSATYARFSLESYVEPRFPGQAAIMRGFGAADMRRTMRELGLATKRS